MSGIGLDRVRAAEWVTKATGYAVSEATVRAWEEKRLLPSRGLGHRRPSQYGLDDLIRLRVLVEVRRRGVSFQKLRRAITTLVRLIPELEPVPARWRLVVTPAGEVRRIESDREALELTMLPGQYVLLDGGAVLADARAALEPALEASAG